MWGQIAAAVLPIVGGALGAGAAAGDRRTGMEMNQELLSYLKNLPIPDVEKQKLILEQLQSQGQLTPEQEQAIQMGPSAMEAVSTDPRLAQTQMSNLDMLSKIAQAGGIDPTIRSDLASALRKQEQAASAQAKAIQQQSEMRGMASSGANMALQQMAAQSEANRQAEMNERLAAQAYANRQNALSNSATLARSIREQSFGEQSRVADAKDLIGRFNTQMQSDVQQRNVHARNLAQAKNLEEKQRIADQNVALSNTQQMKNKDLLQARYENELRRAGLVAPQQREVASQFQARGDATAAQMAGIGAGAGAGIGAVQGQQNYDKLLSSMNKTPKEKLEDSTMDQLNSYNRSRLQG